MSYTSLDDWFEFEILPLEGALTRYLRRIWSNAADIADLRQEIYVRVYESAAKTLPTSPKAFLMATARHLMVDRVRRERVVSIDFTHDLDALNILIDDISPEQNLSARQELRRLSDALDRLSDDCRTVVWMRRVHGLSQKEVAEQLGMQEGTVASHLCRGVQALTKVVLGNGIESDAHSNTRGDDNETGHG